MNTLAWQSIVRKMPGYRIVCFFCICLLITTVCYAQQPTDTWSDVPSAADDRFTNPKSKLYAGPNGWFNFGEVRADVSNGAKTRYAYKGGFHYSTPAGFAAVGENRLRVMLLDFGDEHPAPGIYQVSNQPDLAQKKVQVSFSDASDQQLKEWVSADNAGTVTVSVVNKFLYVKCRNVPLQPTGIHNKGDMKNPMTLGFEGAIAPE